MTGGELLTMRLNKHLVGGILTSIFLLTAVATTSATQGPIYRAETTMTLRAEFVAPRCKLTVPPEVNLGVLSTGVKEYDPVVISVNCPDGAVNTALYAQGVNVVSASDGEKVSMVDERSQPQAELWLKDSNGNIKLDKSKSFCDGNAVTRQCQITPVTNLKQGTPPGIIYATVNFSIEYP